MIDSASGMWTIGIGMGPIGIGAMAAASLLSSLAAKFASCDANGLGSWRTMISLLMKFRIGGTGMICITLSNPSRPILCKRENLGHRRIITLVGFLKRNYEL